MVRAIWHREPSGPCIRPAGRTVGETHSQSCPRSHHGCERGLFGARRHRQRTGFTACWESDSSVAGDVLVVDPNTANSLVWPGENQSAFGWMSAGFVNFNNWRRRKLRSGLHPALTRVQRWMDWTPRPYARSAMPMAQLFVLPACGSGSSRLPKRMASLNRNLDMTVAPGPRSETLR